jgi:hypothetical protein
MALAGILWLAIAAHATFGRIPSTEGAVCAVASDVTPDDAIATQAAIVIDLNIIAIPREQFVLIDRFVGACESGATNLVFVECRHRVD